MKPNAPLNVVVVPCADKYPTDGEYVRRFYMSQIGPTGTALLQLLAAAGSRVWRCGDLAWRLGVGRKAEANNPLDRSLERLEKFRLIERRTDGRVFVRSHLQRLEAHQVARMSAEAQAEHAEFVAQREAFKW